MRDKEMTKLEQDAIAFVRYVVTEIFGQSADQNVIQSAAKRVIAAIPRIS